MSEERPEPVEKIEARNLLNRLAGIDASQQQVAKDVEQLLGRLQSLMILNLYLIGAVAVAVVIVRGKLLPKGSP